MGGQSHAPAELFSSLTHKDQFVLAFYRVTLYNTYVMSRLISFFGFFHHNVKPFQHFSVYIYRHIFEKEAAFAVYGNDQ